MARRKLNWLDTDKVSFNLQSCKILRRNEMPVERWEQLKVSLEKTHICFNLSGNGKSQLIAFVSENLILVI